MKLIWGLDNQYLLDTTIDSSDLWFGEKKKTSKVKFDVISLFNGDLTVKLYTRSLIKREDV